MVKHKKKHDHDFPIEKLIQRLPWYSRLPKRDKVEHPQSVLEFRKWPDLDDAASTHLAYLLMCDQKIRQSWLDSWDQVLAMGPFLNRRKPYSTIPFLIVTDYRRPYRHLLQLSEILADVYQEFLILPDLHIVSSEVVEELDRNQNIQWKKTKMVSVRWLKDS